jgi:protocatechuate 3,4-dioxygenase beta subunit
VARSSEGMTRRAFLEASAIVPLGVVVASCGDDEQPRRQVTQARARTSTLRPTRGCPDGDPTAEQTEGPFFTPRSPRRTSLLAPEIEGERLVLSGLVLSTACRPVPGALVDFWQADGSGRYDNEGFRLRGHQFTDRQGRYRLVTVLPGAYSGRTRHIHVKVQPRGREVLTTQLYFPGEPANDDDQLFDPSLLVERRGARATFDFVVDAA